MRKPTRPCWLCLPFMALVADCNAAEFTGYATLTSDYVYRGVTYSDGNAAFQLGGDVAFGNGVFFGVWGSTIDIMNGPVQRDLEVNYYLGYGHELSSKWSVGLNVVKFTYPGTSGSFDYGRTEYSFVTNFDDRFWFEYAYAWEIYGFDIPTSNAEFYAEWPLQWQLSLGIGAGYYDVSKLVGEGYGYWQIGLSRPLYVFGIDLRYHDTNREVPFISSPDRGGSRFAISLKYSF